MSQGRYNNDANLQRVACLDCGAFVADRAVHDRFHDIGNDHAAAIARLLTSHVSPRVHDRYDVMERLAPHLRGNNWSAEAFAEVAGVGDE